MFMVEYLRIKKSFRHFFPMWLELGSLILTLMPLKKEFLLSRLFLCGRKMNVKKAYMSPLLEVVPKIHRSILNFPLWIFGTVKESILVPWGTIPAIVFLISINGNDVINRNPDWGSVDVLLLGWGRRMTSRKCFINWLCDKSYILSMSHFPIYGVMMLLLPPGFKDNLAYHV